jgi:hypothetical protein
MELDEMRAAWQAESRRAEGAVRVNPRALRAQGLRRASGSLTRLSRLLEAEMVLHTLLLLWLGGFLADHWRRPDFLVPGAVLHLSVIALAASLAWQRLWIAGTDLDAPVVHVQQRLRRLQLHRSRAVRWVFAAAPLLWVPLLVVGLKGVLGLDAYAVLAPAWLAANVLLGVAVLAGAAWAAHRRPAWLRHAPWAQRLGRVLAGHNVNEALAALHTLEEFAAEREPG